MAEEIAQEEGSCSYIEKHCPICEAAKACFNLYKWELEMFQEVLGLEVEIIRGGHILRGDNCCIYTISHWEG
ncbi:hypothetical protein D3P09_07215 [Paenibacillus pinisoli]|uniref:Transcriptional regulator n=1 Tax=Paenibacillus pinisoli TaxID=1276110 RepID=A0A3A6PQL0_9BACL|nr:hypothetical protein D3P09_07215 [Paenibacillus pinisoli]